MSESVLGSEGSNSKLAPATLYSRYHTGGLVVKTNLYDGGIDDITFTDYLDKIASSINETENVKSGGYETDELEITGILGEPKVIRVVGSEECIPDSESSKKEDVNNAPSDMREMNKKEEKSIQAGSNTYDMWYDSGSDSESGSGSESDSDSDSDSDSESESVGGESGNVSGGKFSILDFME